MDTDASWWERLLTLNPTLVRGAVVSGVALVGTVLNKQFVDGTAETVISAFLGLSALLAAVLIKPKVTPNVKVLVRDDTPLDAQPTIVAGEATVPAQFAHEVEVAAKTAG